MDKDSNLGSKFGFRRREFPADISVEYTSAKLLVKQLFTTFERDLATIMARFTEHTTMVEKMSSILEQERKINEEKSMGFAFPLLTPVRPCSVFFFEKAKV